MPLLRKVYTAGTSKVVALPADWIKFQEKKLGCKLTEVEIEVDGELRIRAPTLEVTPA